MEGPEWDAQAHGTVNSGIVAEERVINGRGLEGGHRQGFQRLWDTPVYGDLLQIPGASDLGDRQRLAGGGEELEPGKEGLE